MATTTSLMTFAQFEQMPEDGRRYELRNGEPIEVPLPLHRHSIPQWKLFWLLHKALGAHGQVIAEQGFRPTADYEYRVADVAFVSKVRWDAIPLDGNLMGAPEIVAEVLSPSNSAAEMPEKERLCLENGCREFWVIDPKRRTVRVSTPDGRSKTYRTGQQIPLLFGGELSLDAIFE
jgi:Uma2 family endonuclease